MPDICNKVKKIPLNCLSSEEIEIIKPSGEKAIFTVRRTYYTNEKNKEAGVVTILTDITEKKRIDTERKRHEQFVIERNNVLERTQRYTRRSFFFFPQFCHWKVGQVEVICLFW